MSPESVIFRIVTANKLQRGADLQWVSAFSDPGRFTAMGTFLRPTPYTPNPGRFTAMGTFLRPTP